MKKMFDFFKSSEKSKIKKTEVIVLATPTCISLADFTHSKVIYFFLNWICFLLCIAEEQSPCSFISHPCSCH